MISKNGMGNGAWKVVLAATIASAIMCGRASAVNDLNAQWTLETNTPADATAATGPTVLAEGGAKAGSATLTGVHASSTTWTTPVGNGSANSYSVNTWTVGDYYQLQTSTLGMSGVGIQYDQVSSTTGPRDFKISYSTNGTTFTDFANYMVGPNGVPAWSSVAPVAPESLDTRSFDFTSIAALNNQANIYLRITDTSTASANNTGTVPAGGTDRLDNINIFTNFDKTQSPIIQPPAPPVLPQGNDVVLGYDGNRGNATLDIVRGTATANGGSKPAPYAPWQNVPFVGSSLAFDNLGGTAHNVHGNLLATDFGGTTPTSGGKIYNLATTGSAPFTSSQVLATTPGNRLGQIAVSPNNNKVAVAGADNGQVTVWDYTAGNTQGGSASSTGIRSTTGTPLVPSVATTSGSPPTTSYTQQQQGVAWIDNNKVLSFASNGNLFETDATSMATTAKGSVTPAVGSVLTSSSTSLYYNTGISPYVWALYGGFSPALGNSINTIYVLDPANNYNVLHSVNLSGTTTGGVTTPAGAVPTATGLAFDSAGDLYLAGNGSVVSVIPNAAANALTLADFSALKWFSGNFVSFPGIDVGLAGAVAPGVSGDYNGNGVVDMADYVLWRNGGPLQNDPTPGVQASDYDYWRSRFGATSGSGSAVGSAAVPEPTGAVLLLMGLVALGCKRR